MATATALPTPVRDAPVDRAPARPGHELWPLAAALVGYPVWWLLGLTAVAPVAATLPMAASLWRRRGRLRLPPAFGWWVLFLVWVLISSSALRTDALGAVPGSGGLSRIAVYLYRLAWYVASTIVLLWAVNLDRRRSTFARVSELAGWLFVFCVVGGLAGILLPSVDFRSALELLLPEKVATNSFVSDLVHPGLADVQTVLGYAEARPKAPFAFANTWGSVFSLSLPFFWFGWMLQGRRWQRLVAPFVLVAGAVPAVLSLNRGLWVSLLLGGLVMLVRQASRGRAGSLIVAVVVAAAAVIVLVASPLGTVITERLNHGHSNERRSLLLQATVASASEGSPVIGFGSTRDVQGNFASIAGGSTADCEACGVPPLGTQGHIWLVIFSNGLVGAGLFVLFFALALVRFIRCRGPADTVATLLLVFFAVQVFVYDTLGIPLVLVMLAIGLAAREGRQRAGTVVQAPTFREGLASLRPLVPLALVLGLVGAGIGLGYSLSKPRSYTASTRIALTALPILPDQVPGQRTVARSTIDTESSLLLSDDVLAGATSAGETSAQLRERISVSAPSNTSVLVVDVTGPEPGQTRQTSDEVVRRYLDMRAATLTERRSATLSGLFARQRALAGLVLPADPDQTTSTGPARTRRSRTVVEDLAALQQAIDQVVTTPVVAGQVIRSDPATLDDRELGKFGGSGLAVGVLAGLVIGLLRRVPPRRAASDR